MALNNNSRAYERVLVTGGAGFIGSHLCEALLDEGCEVICLDNFSSGQRSNIAHLHAREGFRLVTHDVGQPYAFEVDAIANLACPASPVWYQADPTRTMLTSVMGAIHAIDAAARTGATILQSSTSEVYGDPEVHPQREDYWGHVNPTGPRACYDEGKRAAETLLFDYHRSTQLPIKVARIFNTYGPQMRADDGRVVSNFIVAALKGQPLTVYGDGSQTRSFCYIDDMIAGLLALLDSADAITGPVNIGNPGEFTVLELAEKVIELTGSPSRIVRLPLPVDDPRQRRPDIAKAHAELGWRPLVPLEAGLLKTIAWFDAQLGRKRRALARPAHHTVEGAHP